MRFGLVCEGATDFITASHFLTKSLAARNIKAEFIDLQPGLDKTSEMNCGWSNALLWLKKNNLKYRKISVLGQGLFSGRLASKKCDAIIVLLDADCAQDVGFFNFCAKHIEPIPQTLSYQESVMFAIEGFCEFKNDEAISQHHIICVSLHNTKSWCAGVLIEDPVRPVEDIPIEETNELLIMALSALPNANYVSEGRHLKDRNLRSDFCATYIGNTELLEARSASYSKLVLDSEMMASRY